jgi:hypothetical protein
MRGFNARARVEVYERLAPGSEVIGYTGTNGRLAGALVYHGHWPGERAARVTGVY